VGLIERLQRSADSPPSVTTRIETPRLVLRPPRTSDLPDLRRAMRDNAAHLKRWSPAPNPGEDTGSITFVSKLVLRHRREWKRGEAYVLLVIERTAEGRERIVGRVAFGGVMRGVFQNAYLGYWIDRERQSQGYMTEAVRASVAWAFRSAGLHRVQAAVMRKGERCFWGVQYHPEFELATVAAIMAIAFPSPMSGIAFASFFAAERIWAFGPLRKLALRLGQRVPIAGMDPPG